jgi:hypothetical protein
MQWEPWIVLLVYIFYRNHFAYKGVFTSRKVAEKLL